MRRVTPIDLVSGAVSPTDPTVTNIAAFLQTIDDDADPSNGIRITQAVRDAASGESVNFQLDQFTFAADAAVLATVVKLTRATAAGERKLVDANTAQNHLAQTLLSSLNGRYAGDFTRTDSGGGENDIPVGSFSFDVVDGMLTGTARINNATINLSGTVSEYGDVEGVSSDNVSFYGVIELDTRKVVGGELGHLGNYYAGQTLSWSGKLQ